MEKKELLIESVPVRLSLVESTGGKVIARGEFGRCGVPTQNKRTYSRPIVEREINRLSEDIERRRMFGELDHPADGKTKLQRVSHIITKMEIDDDGRVVGEAEVLDTPNGKILKAILEANGEVGVSSRGFGSVTPGPNGTQNVGEDFVLKTYDFVADPAMKSAYPEIFSESLQEDYDWEESLRNEFPELVENIEREVAERAKADAADAVAKAVQAGQDEALSKVEERFERRLVQSISSLRESIREEVTEELSSDPSVGGAAGLLSQIAEMVAVFKQDADTVAVRDALKAKDLEVAEATAETDKWRELAKRSGYMLHVEREIGNHPLKDTLISAVGDVSSYSSMRDLNDRLAKVMDELDPIIKERDEAREEAVESARTSEIVALEHENSALREKLVQLSESLKGEVKSLERKVERAVSAAKESDEKREAAELQLEEALHSVRSATVAEAKARAVAGYTNAPKLLEMLEDVDDPQQIKRLVESHGRRTMTDSKLEEIRSRISRGKSVDPREALVESRSSQAVDAQAIPGVDFGTMRQLSGIVK